MSFGGLYFLGRNMKERLIFTKPSDELKEKALEYKNEHISAGENELHGGALLGSMEYDEWLILTNENSSPETVHEDWVVASTFFVLRENDGKIIGMADIRHYLNDFLASFGGHIGYGVRPSERNKGYGCTILSMALEYAKEIGIDEAMIACYDDNYGSKKIIENGGGILQRSFEEGGKKIKVYYINTKK